MHVQTGVSRMYVRSYAPTNAQTGRQWLRIHLWQYPHGLCLSLTFEKKTFSTFSIRPYINVPQLRYMFIAVTFPNRILLSTTCSSLLAMATFLSIRSRWQLRPPSNNCTRSEVCGYRHHVPRGYEWSWLSMETRPFYSLPQTQDQQGGGSRMGYTTESRLELLTIIQTNHGQYKSVVFTSKLTIQWK